MLILNSKNGIIMETLRLSTGIAGRSPRIAPTEALQYQDWVIPPKVCLSYPDYVLCSNVKWFF